MPPESHEDPHVSAEDVAPCCDWRDHSAGPCWCNNHDQSEMHPLGAPRYWGVDLHEEGRYSQECQACGAIVKDTKKHDSWHGRGSLVSDGELP